MRTIGGLTLVGLLLLTSSSDAGSPGARVWDIGSATVEGVVELHATPEAIYQAATDYAHWRDLFSDVKKIAVKSGGRRDAVITFDSETLEHEITIQFNNQPSKYVRFKLVSGPPGAESKGEYVTEPTDSPTVSRVRGRLQIDVKGPASWFVSEKKLKNMRQRKLLRDLDDLRKRFPNPQAPS